MIIYGDGNFSSDYIVLLLGADDILLVIDANCVSMYLVQGAHINENKWPSV